MYHKVFLPVNRIYIVLQQSCRSTYTEKIPYYNKDCRRTLVKIKSAWVNSNGKARLLTELVQALETNLIISLV